MKEDIILLFCFDNNKHGFQLSILKNLKIFTLKRNVVKEILFNNNWEDKKLLILMCFGRYYS